MQYICNPIYSENSIPDELQIYNAPWKVICLRFILGQMDYEDTIDSDTVIQTTNYLDYTTSLRSDIESSIRAAMNLEDDTEYTKSIASRLNNRFYEEIFQCLCAFDSCRRAGNGVEQFLHIYRLLEFLSYPSVLFWARKQIQIVKTYNDFKTAFGNEEVGELKLFEKMQSKIILPSILSSSMNIQFSRGLDVHIIEKYEKAIDDCVNVTRTGSTPFSPPEFSKCHRLIINARNRAFHKLTNHNAFSYDDIPSLSRFLGPIADEAMKFYALVLIESIKIE